MENKEIMNDVKLFLAINQPMNFMLVFTANGQWMADFRPADKSGMDITDEFIWYHQCEDMTEAITTAMNKAREGISLLTVGTIN